MKFEVILRPAEKIFGEEIPDYEAENIKEIDGIEYLTRSCELPDEYFAIFDKYGITKDDFRYGSDMFWISFKEAAIPIYQRYYNDVTDTNKLEKILYGISTDDPDIYKMPVTIDGKYSIKLPFPKEFSIVNELYDDNNFNNKVSVEAYKTEIGFNIETLKGYGFKDKWIRLGTIDDNYNISFNEDILNELQELHETQEKERNSIIQKITTPVPDLVLPKTKSMDKCENGFYKWQEECLKEIGHENAVVVAPPGSGKSLVAYNWANIKDNLHRTIITCPTKAKVNDYARELKDKGLNVGINTGDQKIALDSDCIICTQEIYNAVYAEKKDQMVIMDEFHYALEDPTRRKAYMYGIQKTDPSSKLLVMSATLSSAEYVANELEELREQEFKHFTTDARATEMVVCGKPFAFNEIKNALVFNFRVKDVMDTATIISNTREEYDRDKKDLVNRIAEIYKVDNDFLMRLCETGVAVYYGKMPPNEKAFVTQLYQERIIDTLVGTDALSVGINFPAEKVIFASLEKMDCPLTDKEIMQMSMRAGRSGFYDHGEIGVLLPDPDYKGDAVEYYTNNRNKEFCLDWLNAMDLWIKDLKKSVSSPEYQQEDLNPVDIEKTNFLGQNTEYYNPFAQDFLSDLSEDEKELIDTVVYRLIDDFRTDDRSTQIKHVDAAFELKGNLNGVDLNGISLAEFIAGNQNESDIKPLMDVVGYEKNEEWEEDEYDDYGNYVETKTYCNTNFYHSDASPLCKLQAFKRYMEAWNWQIEEWNKDPEEDYTPIQFETKGIDKVIDKEDPSIYRLNECIERSRELIQEYKEQEFEQTAKDLSVPLDAVATYIANSEITEEIPEQEEEYEITLKETEL